MPTLKNWSTTALFRSFSDWTAASKAAEARDGPIDQVPHVVLVANVCAEEFDFSAECAQLSREVLAGLLVATGDNDAVAFPRESKSRGAPDSSQRR